MEDSKLHEETLKIAKSLIERDPALKDWVTEKFPELKESEDERIRKEIIQSIKDNMCVIHKDKCLAWLEKQGEKSIPEDINEAALQYVDTCAVDGEVTHGNITEPYWNNHSMMNAYKAGWLEKKGKQKSAWSEEDKKILKRIDNLLYSHCQIHGSEYEELHNWLKSLKPNHWKPNEELLKSLPKWKKAKEHLIGEGFIHYEHYRKHLGMTAEYAETNVEGGEYYLELNDLKTLPKEE